MGLRTWNIENNDNNNITEGVMEKLIEEKVKQRNANDVMKLMYSSVPFTPDALKIDNGMEKLIYFFNGSNVNRGIPTNTNLENSAKVILEFVNDMRNGKVNEYFARKETSYRNIKYMVFSNLSVFNQKEFLLRRIHHQSLFGQYFRQPRINAIQNQNQLQILFNQFTREITDIFEKVNFILCKEFSFVIPCSIVCEVCMPTFGYYFQTEEVSYDKEYKIVDLGYVYQRISQKFKIDVNKSSAFKRPNICFKFYIKRNCYGMYHQENRLIAPFITKNTRIMSLKSCYNSRAIVNFNLTHIKYRKSLPLQYTAIGNFIKEFHTFLGKNSFTLSVEWLLKLKCVFSNKVKVYVIANVKRNVGIDCTSTGVVIIGLGDLCNRIYEVLNVDIMKSDLEENRKVELVFKCEKSSSIIASTKPFQIVLNKTLLEQRITHFYQKGVYFEYVKKPKENIYARILEVRPNVIHQTNNNTITIFVMSDFCVTKFNSTVYIGDKEATILDVKQKGQVKIHDVKEFDFALFVLVPDFGVFLANRKFAVILKVNVNMNIVKEFVYRWFVIQATTQNVPMIRETQSNGGRNQIKEGCQRIIIYCIFPRRSPVEGNIFVEIFVSFFLNFIPYNFTLPCTAIKALFADKFGDVLFCRSTQNYNANIFRKEDPEGYEFAKIAMFVIGVKVPANTSGLVDVCVSSSPFYGVNKNDFEYYESSNVPSPNPQSFFIGNLPSCYGSGNNTNQNDNVLNVNFSNLNLNLPPQRGNNNDGINEASGYDNQLIIDTVKPKIGNLKNPFTFLPNLERLAGSSLSSGGVFQEGKLLFDYKDFCKVDEFFYSIEGLKDDFEVKIYKEVKNFKVKGLGMCLAVGLFINDITLEDIKEEEGKVVKRFKRVMLICGESGSGKSLSLKNLLKERRNKSRSVVVLHSYSYLNQFDEQTRSSDIIKEKTDDENYKYRNFDRISTLISQFLECKEYAENEVLKEVVISIMLKMEMNRGKDRYFNHVELLLDRPIFEPSTHCEHREHHKFFRPKVCNNNYSTTVNHISQINCGRLVLAKLENDHVDQSRGLKPNHNLINSFLRCVKVDLDSSKKNDQPTKLKAYCNNRVIFSVNSDGQCYPSVLEIC